MHYPLRSLCAFMIVFTTFAITRISPAAEPFSPVPKPAESFEAGMLHVDKFGAGGQTLVLIPGLAGGAWVWYDTIAHFSPTATLYVITLPGFDGHPATDEKDLIAGFTRDAWAMLAARKIERPVVIGHSLGGTLAIRLAEEHPQRLAGVVAVDGLPVFPMLAGAAAQQREAMAAQIAGVYASYSKDAALAAQRDFMSAMGTNKSELVEPVARLQARSDPKAMGAWLREILTTDLRPNLAKATVPILEIMPHDPADANRPPATTQEQKLALYKSLLADAPKATVVAVAPARHFVMLDQPELFYKAVEQFLSSLHQ